MCRIQCIEFQVMGNNHDKYFGKDQRKILILGFPASGKTTILDHLTKGRQTGTKNQKTKDLTIKDAKIGPLVATFFDLSGGERQRIFWKQHYEGTQGIIFVINSKQAEIIELPKALDQIGKLSKVDNLSGVPFAICLHKVDLITQPQSKQIQKKANDSLKKLNIKYQVFETDAKDGNKMKEMITWLLKETQPL